MRYAEIPGFPGYFAGSDGTIWSSHNNRWGIATAKKQLRPGTNNKYGRKIVVLKDAHGAHRSRHVHRLILEAFIGPCPEGMEACHKNNDAGDNRLANLRWDTRDANCLDMSAHGMKKGSLHHAAKLTEDDVRAIRARHAAGETQQAIADTLSIQREGVGKVIRGERWSHVL